VRTDCASERMWHYLHDMVKLVTILQMIVRLLGVVQIILGLCIWFNIAHPNALHAALGSVFVLVGWAIALIALFALPRRGAALGALLLGGVVIWFGVAQTTLLIGSMHWLVRVAHLLLGVAMIGVVEMLGKAVKLHKAGNAA